MAGKKLQLDVDIATKQAQKNLKDAAAQAKKLGDELDDTESAGKKMAKALNAVADIAETELKSVQAIAEQLGNALGPEFAADTERGEQAIKEMALQLHNAGLSAEQVEADVDDLAAALKRVDSAAGSVDNFSAGMRRGTDDISDGFRRVSAEADNSRSVVANFAGNATQELPGVAGALGPLNMALGQFAEYATEGNIKLKNFIAAGGGLALISVAMGLYAKNAERAAKAKAFDTKTVEDYAAALGEAATATGAITSALREAGKVEFTLPFGDIVDVTGQMAELGLTVEQFASIVARGPEGINAYKDALDDAGASGEASGIVLLALADHYDKVSKAQEIAAQTAKVFGGSVDDADRAYIEFAEGAKKAYDNVTEFEGGVEDATDEVDDLTSAVDDLRDALSDKDAIDDMVEAQQEFVWYSAEAARVLASESASLEEKAAAQATADEAMRRSIDTTIDYLETTGGIPRNIATLVETHTNNGQLAEAERLLSDLARDRNSVLNVSIRTSGKFLSPEGKKGPGRAAGGPTSPNTLHEVTEGGKPELLDVGGRTYLMMGNQGGMVRPAATGAGATGAAGVTNNITINMPAGSNGEDVVRAIRRYEQVNGAGWRG